MGHYRGFRVYVIDLQSVPHFTLESLTLIAARPPIASGRTRQTEFFDNEVTGRIDCFSSAPSVPCGEPKEEYKSNSF